MNKYLKVLLSSVLLLTIETSFSRNVSSQGIGRVFDRFTDGEPTDGADQFDISWFGISSNFYQTVSTPSQILLTVVEDSVIRDGNALKLDNPSFTSFGSSFPPPHFAIGTFAPFDLEIGGAGVILRFNFRFTTKPSASTTSSERPQYRVGGLRFGLYNSASTAVMTNILAPLVGSGTSVEDDGGYLVSVGLAGTNSLEVSRENFNGGDSITGGNGGLSLNSNTFASTIDDTVTHRATLIIRRNDFQRVEITATVDNSYVMAIDSGTGIITSFDQIVVRSAFSDLDINIDNVQFEREIVLGTFGK